MAENDIQPDSIVYAPVAISHLPHFGGSRIAKYGIELIQRLLDKFYNYKVVFRPTPSDIDSPEVHNILSHFASNPRFIFDNNPNRDFSFRHGIVLITDVSNVLKTFTFATLRPALYYQPWDRRQPEFVSYDAGYIARTLDGLTNGLSSILENLSVETERIKKMRAIKLCPPENAFQEIADWVQDFFYQRPRTSWISIERLGNPVPDHELINKIRKQHKGVLHLAASFAARYTDQENPLLAAFALHSGMENSPYTNIDSELCSVATRLSGIDIGHTRYDSINPDVFRNLYHKALQGTIDCIKKKLIFSLLSHFHILRPMPRLCKGSYWRSNNSNMFNAWAVGFIANMNSIKGIAFCLDNLFSNNSIFLTIIECDKSENVINIDEFPRIYQRRYKISELNLYDDCQEVFFDLSGLVVSSGTPYLAVVAGDNLLGAGESVNDLAVGSQFFRGYYSRKTLPYLYAIASNQSLAFRLIYM